MKTRSKALHFLVFFLIICQVLFPVSLYIIWARMMLSFAVRGPEPKPPSIFFFASFLLALLIITPLSLLFYILMIVDAAKRKFANDSQRTLWIVLVAVSLMLWLIPAYVYYFLHGRKPRELPELEVVEKH